MLTHFVASQIFKSWNDGKSRQKYKRKRPNSSRSGEFSRVFQHSVKFISRQKWECVRLFTHTRRDTLKKWKWYGRQWTNQKKCHFIVVVELRIQCAILYKNDDKKVHKRKRSKENGREGISCTHECTNSLQSHRRHTRPTKFKFEWNEKRSQRMKSIRATQRSDRRPHLFCFYRKQKKWKEERNGDERTKRRQRQRRDKIKGKWKE